MPNRNQTAQTDCLMLGMADKLGIDPAVSVSVGDLGQSGLDAMVGRCRSCAHGDDCILWMVEHAGGADATPGYCLNGEELDLLRRKTT